MIQFTVKTENETVLVHLEWQKYRADAKRKSYPKRTIPILGRTGYRKLLLEKKEEKKREEAKKKRAEAKKAAVCKQGASEEKISTLR